MDHEYARQIADLLNGQNQLAGGYDAARVLAHAGEYLIDLSDDGRVACCAQLKKVQWYQSEIAHVTTHPDFVRQGRGLSLIGKAEALARASGARLLQCTIRAGNIASEAMFKKAGFERGVTFHNQETGNRVSVWAKALAA